MWKEIKGFEGYYEVSDSGEVRSLNRIVCESKGVHAGKEKMLKGKMMKQSLSGGRGGYPVVNLHKNRVSSVRFVHTLVAEAFLPNPNHYPTVNHIDGNKQNNSVSNLEWASFSRNNMHALQTGLRSPRGNAIAQYTKDGVLVKTYKSACEAARENGFSRGMISHCLNGRAKTASGFVWRKLSESPTTIP